MRGQGFVDSIHHIQELWIFLKYRNEVLRTSGTA